MRKLFIFIIACCLLAGYSKPAIAKPLTIDGLREVSGKAMDAIMREQSKTGEITQYRKVEVLNKIIEDNGYSVAETLHKYAEEGINLFNGVDTQIIGFLILPASELQEAEKSKLYSKQELEDMKKIEQMMNRMNGQ